MLMDHRHHHDEHPHDHHVDHSVGEHHGHHDHDGGHHHHHHGDFKSIFLKSLPLAIPILLLSPMMGIELPFQFSFPYSDVLVTLLATILFIYGGKPFFQGAIQEIKDKAPSMMALVTLGISVSYFYSVFAVMMRYLADRQTMDFFFELASLILIMLLGHWIEMIAVGEAGDAQKSLAVLLPKDAQVVLEDESIVIRPISELTVGDMVRVQAGENIPADGKVMNGSSKVNEAIFTGESKPIEKTVGDAVIGGTTNGDGVLFVRVEETGDKSFLSQVQTLISDAQSQTSKGETLANKVASWLFYIALLAAVLSFFIWLSIADLQTAIHYTVTTLVIACPHALGLAIPLVIARSTSLGAGRGLLVKNREALELATKADVIILDKTGTITTGEFKVLAVERIGNKYKTEELIALMKGIEAGSSHPIAQSIIQYADSQGIEAVPFDSIEIVSGAGIQGKAKGHLYELISQKAHGKDLPIDLPKGATVSILVEDGDAIGVVALGDEIKKSSRALIRALSDYGIRPLIATGDNETAAYAVAEELQIGYKANQSPQDKYELVEHFKSRGIKVIMVGDGVNDAPSLALADVGIAIGAGTQVALDSADVVLTQSEPVDIISFLMLARRTNRKMVQNLVWGAGYNFLAIPIAAGLLFPLGITLTPAIGAVLMSLSTILVAINAMMLRLDTNKYK